MKKITCILLLFAFFLIKTKAVDVKKFFKFNFNQNCKNAYKYIYQNKLQKANDLLIKEDGTNLVPYYLYSLVDFTEIFVNDENLQIKSFLDINKQRIEVIQQGPNQPWKSFFIAEIELQEVMVELMQGQTKNTGEKLTKAYNLLTEINYTAHNFLLAKRDKLFLEAICSALPPRFKALKIDPIYIKDKLNDLKLVTQRIENSKDYELFTKQSYIMLCIVQFYINNQPQECWKNVLKITEDYPVNQISALFRIYFAQELSKNQVSWEVLVNYQNQKNIPTIFNYYRGLVDLQRLDPRGGFFMSKFLKKNPGQRFVKSAYLNLGYAFLLNKDTFYYRNALKLGRKFGSITN